MKGMYLFISCFLAIPGFSQTKAAPAFYKLVSCNDPDNACNLAKTDLASGNRFLVLRGGIAPVARASDAVFERRFKIQFRDFGCVGPQTKILAAYDTQVFKALTAAYGSRWVFRCRADVPGLAAFKNKIGAIPPRNGTK